MLNNLMKDAVYQFLKRHAIYKNHFGKISPYVYILTKYSDALNDLLISTKTYHEKNALLVSYINDSFYRLSNEAKRLNISHELFDYVGIKNLKKIEMKVCKNKSIEKAISALYMACLAGDKLSVISTKKTY